MSGFTARVVESFSSLRSTVLVGLNIMTTNISSQLSALLPGNHPFADTHHSSGVSLSLINVQMAVDSLPVGAHLVGPRTFYMHHGIYLGGGKVAHYSGFSSSFKPGPVEVIDLESFAHGKPVWMYQEQCEFASHEIAHRARSRIGENQYRIFSNNCEHFCSWCISGKSYSAQVNAYWHCPRSLFSFISALEHNFVA
ncbi:MAG: lecithin retinol acyltransferase family protein [Pseudomonas mandelii]